MANLFIEVLALSLKTLDIRGEALELALSGHRLLENHLNALKALLLILKLTAQNIIAELAIAPRLISKVIEHAVRSYVVAVHFPHIHESLLNSE